MNKAIGIGLTALAAIVVSGCTTTGAGSRPVDVTRFHLGQPVARGTFSLEPLSTNVRVSPEFQTYAGAVGREMEKLGFRPSNAAPGDLIVAVAFTRATRGFVEKRPPVSIGIGAGGGGGYRGGLGLGGGLGFGVGGGQREVVGSELAVQIRRRSDATTIWEGRAVTDSIESTPGAQPVFQADRLANALFRNFPGESGITTTVK